MCYPNPRNLGLVQRVESGKSYWKSSFLAGKKGSSFSYVLVDQLNSLKKQ